MSTSATQVPPTAPARPPQGAPAAPPSQAAFGATIDPVRLLKRYKLHLAASVVAGVVLGVAAYFPLLYLTPRFRADVIFEAKPPIEDATMTGVGTTGQGGSGVQEMNLFMQTLVADMLGESLRGQLAVHPTVRNQTEFAKHFERGGNFDLVEATDTIKSRLKARVIPETAYLQMSFTAGNRSDSATIVNTAADLFLARVNTRSNERIEETVQSITARRRSVQIERREKERQMQRLLGDNRMESLDMRLTDAATTVQSLSIQIAELRNTREVFVDRLKTYEEIRASPEGIVYPDEVRAQVQTHPHIASYNQQLAAYRANLRAMRERFGPNHYQIRQIENLIRGTETERDAEEQRLLAEAFNNTIEGARLNIASIDATLREADANRATALLRMQEVTRTQAEFETLKADAERLAGQEVELSAQLDNVQALMQRQSVASRIQLVQRGVAPDKPVFPRLTVIIPAATFLTVALVGGLIVLRELLEQRVRMPADVQLIPRARLLGVIADVSEDPSRPASMDSAVRDRPEGVIAEQVRQLRTSISKARQPQQGGYALLVVGAMPGSGASSVIAALAHCSSALGDRTLVIDANLRKPRMHQYMGVADAPGLSDVLAGEKDLSAAVQRTPGDRPVDVLAAGARASRVFERLNSDRMSALLAEARSKYDIILIDAPPMVVAGDATVLAGRVDGSALVARTYQETRGLIARVTAQLNDAAAKHLGVVVNGVKASAGGYYRRNFRLAHQYNASASTKA